MTQYFVKNMLICFSRHLSFFFCSAQKYALGTPAVGEAGALPSFPGITLSYANQPCHQGIHNVLHRHDSGTGVLIQ